MAYWINVNGEAKDVSKKHIDKMIVNESYSGVLVQTGNGQWIPFEKAFGKEIANHKRELQERQADIAARNAEIERSRIANQRKAEEERERKRIQHAAKVEAQRMYQQQQQAKPYASPTPNRQQTSSREAKGLRPKLEFWLWMGRIVIWTPVVITVCGLLFLLVMLVIAAINGGAENDVGDTLLGGGFIGIWGVAQLLLVLFFTLLPAAVFELLGIIARASIISAERA